MEVIYRSSDILHVLRYGRMGGFTVVEVNVFHKADSGETISGVNDTWTRVATAVPLADFTGVTTGYLDLPLSPGNEEIDRATFDQDILTIDAAEVAAGRPGYLENTNRELQKIGIAPVVAP